ncbi:50S ribosomal protein L11 methyltransferase [Oceanicoccus sp. KOV_DT_Chl]|uniref:50S ribosomal protein L11 methyltransferase n=1 Tax=Oceanicoccus sp. KOV_DT_Chl TaxID=1904639 RepID=UPI000C7D8458|nr:50S ribosomal protein L11 methyltransferase [Oceanicoccus sp. KOV_DT_Chl]
MNKQNEQDQNPSHYRMSYRDVAMHKVMLQDVVRTDAYEQAIAEVVKPEHTVLDFGCGTGILAMFAARAGASKVIAVDRSPFIKTAKEIAQANNFDSIDFYHDDHQSLQLDKKVDVIVSEWMGHCLFYEAMLEPLLAVRDRYLAADGIMIPAEVSLHAGLVCDEDILEDLCFLKDQPYDIDFSPIAHVPLQQTDLVTLDPECILENTAHLGSLDMHTINKATTPRVFSGTVTPEKNATVFALCSWFSSALSSGVEFGTGPSDMPTHWDQILFPLPEPFVVSPGRELTITISPLTEQVGKEQFWSWSITDGITTLSVNEQSQPLSADLPQGKI